MNFPTVPTVPQALAERAQHPAYGYFETADAYYDAIIQWQVQRNGCDPALLTRDCIGYENGVLGGVVSALTSFAGPGDPVLVHSPTYIGFTKSLHNNGFRIVHSPLVQDEQGVWRMGLRRHGPQAQTIPHPCSYPVQPPQPLRPGLDPGGARAGHGGLQKPTTAWSSRTRSGPTFC